MNILGIDPGLNGGFAILKNGHFYLGEAMPKVETRLSFLSLTKRLQHHNLIIDHIWIELVRNIKGVTSKSNFSFGRNFQICICASELQGKEIDFVGPRTWQNYVFDGVPEIWRETKAGKKKDTKAMAMIKAQNMWPNADFTKNEKSKKPHDGIIDAALIAYYGYLKLTDQLPILKKHQEEK